MRDLQVQLRRLLRAERDGQIAKYLREHVFPAKRSALLRLISRFSKRDAHLISQCFKYTRKDGKKTRTKLAADSCMPLPVPFELKDIKLAEAEAIAESNLVLNEHGDKKGADIGGQMVAGVDL